MEPFWSCSGTVEERERETAVENSPRVISISQPKAVSDGNCFEGDSGRFGLFELQSEESWRPKSRKRLMDVPVRIQLNSYALVMANRCKGVAEEIAFGRRCRWTAELVALAKLVAFQWQGCSSGRSWKPTEAHGTEDGQETESSPVDRHKIDRRCSIGRF